MASQGVRGTVLETLPDLKYLVELEDGSQVKCYVSGKMKLNKIKVLIGDIVEVVLDPFKGKTTNRIIRRIDRQ